MKKAKLFGSLTLLSGVALTLAACIVVNADL